MEQLSDLLNRIPFMLFLVLYLLMLGMGYHSFLRGDGSPLKIKRDQTANLQNSNKVLQDKYAQAQAFYKSLEVKKAEIRNLAFRLNETRETLSERLDVPAFIKMVITEARKTGLQVRALRPVGRTKQSFYVEHRFNLEFQGVFAQLVVLIDRLANAPRIVRIDDMNVKPTGTSSRKFVQIQGNIFLKAYEYSGSRADEIARASKEGKLVKDPSKGVGQ